MLRRMVVIEERRLSDGAENGERERAPTPSERSTPGAEVGDFRNQNNAITRDKTDDTDAA
jgi:hypothetical protein